jgi:hypothetical protein
MGVTFNDYNRYNGITKYPINIISYLLNNNDIIWKLLKYDTSNALSQPNLTKSQKSSLIYAGQTDETPYRVFTKALPNGATETAQTQLRVWLGRILPTNRVQGQVDIKIQVVSYNSILTLDTYENRNEVILQQLISTLSQQNIKGMTPLSFDQMGNGLDNNASWYRMGEKWYEGYMLTMSCKVG